MRISNIKGIKSLEPVRHEKLKFSERFNVIYGANGSGKTTVMECMSLIGHLGAIPVTVLDNISKQAINYSSFLNECAALRSSDEIPTRSIIDEIWSQDEAKVLRSGVKVSIARFHELENYDGENLASGLNLAHTRLSDLFDKVSSKGQYGTVEVLLEIGEGTKRSTGILVFVLKSETQEFARVKGVNITDHLSMGVSDIEFGNNVSCIVSSDFPSFWLLYGSLATKRGYQFSPDNHDRIWHPRENLPEFGENLRCGVCSYVNTDLYDFGRANDLRESPKRTGDVAYQQLVTRLALPFDNRGNFEKLGSTKKSQELSLNSVLSNVFGNREDREFHRFWHENGELKIEVTEHGDTHTISHLSLGENEVFFIATLLLGQENNHGIVILDEPAGGLAADASGRFYVFLARIAHLKDIQIFITTHKLDPVIYLDNPLVSEIKRLNRTHTVSPADHVIAMFDVFTREQREAYLGMKKYVEGQLSAFAHTIARDVDTEIHKTPEHANLPRSSLIFHATTFLIAIWAAYLTIHQTGSISFRGMTLDASSAFHVVTMISAVTAVFVVYRYYSRTILIRRHKDKLKEITDGQLDRFVHGNTDEMFLKSLREKVAEERIRSNHHIRYLLLSALNRCRVLYWDSLVKTAIFTGAHFLVAFTLVSFLSDGDFLLAGLTAAIEPIANAVVFFVLDRVYPNSDDKHGSAT